MSLMNHLEELIRRHQALDQKIKEALLHPSTDSQELRDLKKRKLTVKEEIEKLRSTSQQQTVH